MKIRFLAMAFFFGINTSLFAAQHKKPEAILEKMNTYCETCSIALTDINTQYTKACEKELTASQLVSVASNEPLYAYLLALLEVVGEEAQGLQEYQEALQVIECDNLSRGFNLQPRKKTAL